MSLTLTSAVVYASSSCGVNTDSTISSALLSGHFDIFTTDAESGRISSESGLMYLLHLPGLLYLE